jgi:hypothetical protein
MILGEFVPPGAKWYMWGFRAARGLMVYVGISCRQGHNGICGNFVPPGAKWYMWRFVPPGAKWAIDM